MEQPQEENIIVSSEFTEIHEDDLDQVTGGGLFDRLLGQPIGQYNGQTVHQNAFTHSKWLVDENGNRVSEKFKMYPTGAPGSGQFRYEDKKGNRLNQIPMRKPR
jgi:hypothetical protein